MKVNFKNIKSAALFTVQIICYYVILVLTSNYSTAQVYTGPVSSATGGAGRAATEVGETVLLNPATIVHSPQFSGSLFYSEGYWDKDSNERVYAGSLIDNHEGAMLPGGVSYVNRRRSLSSLSSFDEMFIQATIGHFITTHLAAGLAVTYLDQDFDKGYTQWNGQLGFMYNPSSKLGLGLVVQNFIEADDDIPGFLKEPLSVGGGLTYLFDKFLKLKADVVAFDDESKGWRGKYMVGVESLMGAFGAIRLGFNKNDLSTYKYYTFGLGFNGPRFRLDYSYQQKDTNRRGAMHSVDFRVPL